MRLRIASTGAQFNSARKRPGAIKSGAPTSKVASAKIAKVKRRNVDMLSPPGIPSWLPHDQRQPQPRNAVAVGRLALDRADVAVREAVAVAVQRSEHAALISVIDG